MAEAPEKLTFELVSPERLLISEEVEMVVVPGREGDFGVLPQHSPLISTVRPGVIDIYQDGGSRGGKPAHAFKKTVDEFRAHPGQIKRQ